MDKIALSLALIIVLGLVLSRFFSRVGLPGLLGMLLLGVAIGPYGLNWIDPSFLGLSGDLRIIALIIILLRAGLGLHRDAIRKVGMPAVKMSFIPCLLEGLAITFLANQILGLSYLEAGMLGFIIAAVSPAVIVPQMLSFIERGMGTARGIPTLILAGASADDVVAITVFSVFLGTYLGKSVNLVWTVLGIPLSIILGIISGLILGFVLLYLFRRFKIRNSEKLLLILAAAIFLKGLGDALQSWIPMAGLLGVMVVGFVIVDRNPNLGVQLSEKFTKVWILAEIILFVLVGAQVNIYLAISAGMAGILIIGGGLLARSLGVYLSLLGTKLTLPEKIFSMIAYTPKATVQAAMGAVPLAAGVASGDIILAISVLAILFTAPLGAIGVKMMGERVLKEEKN
ncbi:MAG TPA: cation:proton antiporter [Methanobacteriaceae archaeon]|nr:cation:proton antiporter [Methanobacteriaceae archaeon]